MFNLSIHGRFGGRQPDGSFAVLTPHQQHGYREPYVVACAPDDSVLQFLDDYSEGDSVFCRGHGWQERGDGRVSLACAVNSIGHSKASLVGAAGPITVTAHGQIHDDPVVEVIDAGKHAGQDVCKFKLHCQVPEMQDGIHVVLMCRLVGSEARWVGHRHRDGDRINVEGSLYPLDWQDGGGVDRTAHLCVISRWLYAKPSPMAEAARQAG